MNHEEPKYSVHKQYEIADKEADRTRSDAELLKGGARYRVNEKGEKILEATPEQKYIIDKYRNYSDKEKIKEFIEAVRRRAVEGPGNLDEFMRFSGKDKEMKKVRFTLKNGSAIECNISDLSVKGWPPEDSYLSYGSKSEDSVRISEIDGYQFVP